MNPSGVAPPRRGAVVLRTPNGGRSVRLPRRPFLVGTALAAAALAVAVLSLGSGTVRLSPAEVVATLAGGGPPGAGLVVLDLRLPRVLDALLAGLAMGASGAVFQSLSRNPLGSPDIVGFGNGASAGALIAIIVLDAGAVQTTAGALAGGLLTALAVYLLAWRGGVHGHRLVLTGIGVSAVLGALTEFLFVRADLGKAAQAATWMVGSLGGRDWGDVTVAAVGLAVLAPALLPLARRLAMLEMGDDAASALGVRAERDRLALLAVGTGLVAMAVAAAGPIPFVALASPQLARRLTRSGTPGPVTAGLMGALLVTAADWTAQRLPGPSPLPVGVVTGVLGGVYLSWLLLAERRSGAL
ncbi:MULTISPECIES: FecCD family ABC transporter permease [Actinomadura]|uniref:FecCD family ABC transporter permease n=1 Tax=Actinomadura yumaensis TaxID=111807 RepID=A0ABW2CSP6_9ACTN|nr:iron chelate uptake ABC transporter family permease subunit [Actinomadura sp. J1-007]MWK40588.1 iron chelate uptake ABC transporter family permease subunit [Actinomadura sp. J1-007]